MERRVVLVLDLDLTLIRSIASSYTQKGCTLSGCDGRCSLVQIPRSDGAFQKFYIHLRPGLDKLAEVLSNHENLDVCIFTAGVRQYAFAILRLLPKEIQRRVVCILDRNHLITDKNRYIKTFSTVRESITWPCKIVTIDDDPIHYPDRQTRDVRYVIPEYRGPRRAEADQSPKDEGYRGPRRAEADQSPKDEGYRGPRRAEADQSPKDEGNQDPRNEGESIEEDEELNKLALELSHFLTI